MNAHYHIRRCRLAAGCFLALLHMGILQAGQTPRQERSEFFRLLDLNNLSLTNWNKPLLAVGAQLTNAAALPSDEQALSVYASALSNLLANIPAHPYSCCQSRVLADPAAFASNFVSWLDLDYPGLEAVKTQAVASNYPSALSAWRDYTVQKLRRINSPQLYQQSNKGSSRQQNIASLLLGAKTYGQYLADGTNLYGGVDFYEIYGMSGAPGTSGPISWTNQPPTADTALDVLYGYNSFAFASPLLFRYWRGAAIASGANLTLTCSGTQVTALFTVPHGLTNGETVTVYSATPTNYNGLFEVTVVNPTSVTYTALSAPGTSPASGSGRALARSRDPLPLQKWFEILSDYSTRHKNMISSLHLVEASAAVRSQYRTIYESADWGIRAGPVLGQSGRLSELLASLALFSKMLPEETLTQRDWYSGIEKPNDTPLAPGALALIPQEPLARIALSLMADTSEALQLAYLRVGMTPNQRLHGLTSLYLLSMFFEEFKAASELLRQTDVALANYADTMFYQDGPMLERSPNYNESDADKVRTLLRLSGTNSTPGLLTLANKLDPYQRVFAYMQTPLGGLPRMASYCTPNPPALWQGGALLSSWRTTFRASVADATETTATNLYLGLLDSGLPVPSCSSSAFPYAGYYLLRNDWSSRSHFLFFANTPPGNGHHQMDHNGIQVCAFGRNLLSTAGPPPYDHTFVDASQYDDYTGFAAYQGEASSFKVNTVAVDGRSQNAGFTYNATVTNVPMPGLWHASPTFDYVEGTYSGGYGNGKRTGYYNPFTNGAVAVTNVTHTRSVAFLRDPGIWIVTDVLAARDTLAHDYRQIWNFPAYSATYGPTYGFATNEVIPNSAEQRISTVDADGPNVHFYHLGPQQVTYETYAGCRAPYLGWAGNGIGGLRLPAANVHAVWKGVGTQLVVTVIAPSDTGAASPVTAVRTNSASASAIDLVLDLANGHTLRIAQGLQARTLTVGNQSISAQTVIADAAPDGSQCGFALTAAGFAQTNFSFTASATHFTPLAEIGHPTNSSWISDGDWLLPSSASPQNTPPVIAQLPDQRTPANAGPLAIPFTIGDNESQATNLTVTAHSLDQTLLPDANMTLSGDGTNRTVTVTPAPGLFGTVAVELTVTDTQGLSSATRFTLAVFATQYWDASPAAGLQAGSGSWSGSATNWSSAPSGSDTRSAWVNSGNNAVFAGGGGAYTVTVSDTQTVNDLLFSVVGCTVTGGALSHPHGFMTVCADADATLNTPLLACGDVVKTGADRLTLGAACDYPGDTAVSAGTLRLAADNALPPASGLTLGNGLTAGNLVLTNAGQTVRWLSFAGATNAVTNRLEIADGHTLAVAGSLAVGGVNADIMTLAEVAGLAGTFVVANDGATVQIGMVTNASNNNRATLNLSDLGTFSADLGTNGTLRVGENFNDRGGNQSLLLLAVTNTLTVGTLGVGEGGRGYQQLLKFGRGHTRVNARTINLGTGARDSAAVTFAAAAGTLTVRGETGANRAALNLGTGGTTAGAGASNLLDLRGHACDLLLSALTIGEQARSSSPTHTLLFNEGVLDVTRIAMARTTGSGTSTSTLGIGGGTVHIGTGGLLLASNAVGVLNITGGTVTTDGDIVKGTGGTGTASLTLNGINAVLDLCGHVIGSAADPVNALFVAGTLRNLGEFNGGADFVKGSNTVLTLDGTNTYTGRTLVSNGTLRITGSLANASAVEVFPGATLDLTGTLTADTLHVRTNAYFFDKGTLNARLVVDQGGSVSANGGGTLTVGGGVTNNGLISVSKGTTLTFNQPVVNNGTINSYSGHVVFLAGVTGSGTLIDEPPPEEAPVDGIWRTPSTTEYGQENNWVDGVIAGGAGATLSSYSSQQMDLPTPTLNCRTNVVLGNLVVPADASASATIVMSPRFGENGHTESLIFDSGTAGVSATLRNNCVTNAARIKIRCDIQLKSELSIAYNATNKLAKPNTAVYLTGNISEDGARRGLTVSNLADENQISVFGDNTFSGDVEVRQGILRAQSYTRLGGVGHQFGRDNTLIATNAGSQIDLGGFSFGPDQRLLLSGCGVGGLGVLVASQQSPCYTSVWSGPITLAGDSAVGMGYHTSYLRKTGSALALTGAISDQGAGYKLIKNSQNTLFLRGTNTYSGGTILSNGYLTATCRENLGTGPLVFAGGAFLFESPWDITSAGVALTHAASAVVRLRLAERDVTFNGALGPFGCNVLKSGRGTLTLTRTGTHQNLLICEGAVNLDYTASSEAKLPAAYSVNLYNDASLSISGGAQPFTNTIHSVNPQAGCAGAVSLSGAAGTRFNLEGTASCGVGTGEALDLSVQAGTTFSMSRSGLDANMLNTRITYNGGAFVSRSADGTAIPYASASADWDTATARHMDVLAATPAAVPAGARIRTLRFNDPSAGQLTLQGDTGLTNGAILVTAAMGATVVHIQGGTLTSAQGNELIVHQYNTQAVLRLSSLLTNTPAGGALILTKTGPGTLVLSDVANTFSGTIYVLGGTLEIESQRAFGATNRAVYVYNGATLRLRGQQTLGVGGSSFVLYCNAAGGIIDVPNTGDRVTILGRVGMQSHGLLTKVGKGTLTLSNWTQQQNENFLSIPSWNYTVEEGTLDLGDQTYGNRWLSGECLVLATVKNKAVLRGAGFLFGHGATNGGGSSEDEQGAYHLHVAETGGIVDLHGVSVTMGVKGDETYSCDFISGSGRLTVTNSSASAATVSFNGAHFNRFMGVFDGAKYLTKPIVGGGLPGGELSVPGGVSVDFGTVAFPYKLALGRLTGAGNFGGKNNNNHAQPPLLVGRDADETFECSGCLWGTSYDATYTNYPFRYTKVGSNAWRVSGTTNAMTGDVTVRKGTILVGANSPGQGTAGALGKAKVLLGDIETGADGAALLTDGPYTVGNALVLAGTGGTLTLGGNQATGSSLFTSGLELTRDVVLTSANTDGNGVTFSGAIAGPGGITKTGVGTVYLTGIVSNTGPTFVQQGSLVVQGAQTFTNTLTVAANSAGSGTLAVQGDLTLGAGARLALSAGTLDRGQTYTLVTWSGTRAGLFAPVDGLPPAWYLSYLSNSLVLYYKPSGTSILIR